MIDISAIDAQCIHTLKLAAEAFIAACFGTFLWITLPYVRGQK